MGSAHMVTQNAASSLTSILKMNVFLYRLKVKKTHILPLIWKTRIDLAQFLILLWQSCQGRYNFAYYVAFVDNNPS